MKDAKKTKNMTSAADTKQHSKNLNSKILRLSMLMLIVLSISIITMGCKGGQGDMGGYGDMGGMGGAGDMGGMGGIGGAGDMGGMPTDQTAPADNRALGGGAGDMGDLGGADGMGDLGGADGMGDLGGAGDMGDLGGAGDMGGDPGGMEAIGDTGGVDDGAMNPNDNPQLEQGERPAIIIAHGMGASGGVYGGLANAFSQEGYDPVLTPSNGSAFDPSHVIQAAGEVGDRPMILVGHSAGGRAVQAAAAQLDDRVIGVISIDGAPANTTNPNVPHAFFRHESDGFGSVVGNANPQVPQENIIGGDVQTLPGGHLVAPFGNDAEHYIEAAREMEARASGGGNTAGGAQTMNAPDNTAGDMGDLDGGDIGGMGGDMGDLGGGDIGGMGGDMGGLGGGDFGGMGGLGGLGGM